MCCLTYMNPAVSVILHLRKGRLLRAVVDTEVLQGMATFCRRPFREINFV